MFKIEELTKKIEKTYPTHNLYFTIFLIIHCSITESQFKQVKFFSYYAR